MRSQIDKKKGVLRYEDVREISSIYCPGHFDSWITGLGGIECLTGLQRIDLTEHFIPNLEPLSNLVELTYLQLDYCTIDEIGPLSSLVKLNDLSLANNFAIADITALSGLDALENLNLSGNEVVDINPLAGLVNLSIVDLSSNDIETIEPLVENMGIGDGDYVSVEYNPISCTEQAANIQALRDKGVDLHIFCP